jgi:uncharacterized protein with NAD-binding domain and iron-sulfur cluster
MNETAEKKAAFKVIVAGGGIAGLTQANSLERAGSKLNPEANRVLTRETITYPGPYSNTD